MSDEPGIVYALDAAGNRVTIRSGSPATFDNVIQLNGGVYDLTGKTVTATLRAALVPNSPIDDDLEDFAVTLGGETDEDEGGVSWLLSAEHSAMLGPDSAALNDAVVYYDVAYKVMPDGYLVSEVLRFGVTRGQD